MSLSGNGTTPVVFEAPKVVAPVGTIRVAGKDHPVRVVKMGGLVRIQQLQAELRRATAEGDDVAAAAAANDCMITTLQLALPTLTREEIDELEVEVVEGMVTAINRALEERRKAREEANRDTPFSAAS